MAEKWEASFLFVQTMNTQTGCETKQAGWETQFNSVAWGKQRFSTEKKKKRNYLHLKRIKERNYEMNDIHYNEDKNKDN